MNFGDVEGFFAEESRLCGLDGLGPGENGGASEEAEVGAAESGMTFHFSSFRVFAGKGG